MTLNAKDPVKVGVLFMASLILFVSTLTDCFPLSLLKRKHFIIFSCDSTFFKKDTMQFYYSGFQGCASCVGYFASLALLPKMAISFFFRGS